MYCKEALLVYTIYSVADEGLCCPPARIAPAHAVASTQCVRAMANKRAGFACLRQQH